MDDAEGLPTQGETTIRWLRRGDTFYLHGEDVVNWLFANDQIWLARVITGLLDA